MGVVISWPERQVAKPVVDLQGPLKPCEILFFTGVRYERHEQDVVGAAKPGRPASGGPRNGTSRRRRG
jgi:hypothetical protein